MLIAIAPKLLAATRAAYMFWVFATSGAEHFREVPSCDIAEAVQVGCISVSETKDAGNGRVGVTYKFNKQYVTLVLAPDVDVLTHEIGHYVIGMRYHAPNDTSIMSPSVGHKCLTHADAEAYAEAHPSRARLQLRCL